MATITSWVTTAQAAADALGVNKVYVQKTRVDFTVFPSGASDVVQVIAIPAGTLVIDCGTKLITAEGKALTATLGDGSGANSWDGSIDLNASAGTRTMSVVGTDAYSASAARGKLYTAADTIDLTMSAATGVAAVIDVFAVCVDLN